jgi:GntR family transcriptional regulator/MocR family aminotransferase
MSLNRRLALLEWSREARAWIVEDDYDSEYRFSGRPLEALHGLDRAGRVLYIGTFSKVLFPSLRLGYLVTPPELLAGLKATQRLIAVHPPLLEQLALTDFLIEGYFARHIRKMRQLYQERRDALVEALTREPGNKLDITVPEAGMHLSAWLPAGMSAQAVAQRAAKSGLHILPISNFSQRVPQRDGLVLGFANSSPQELRAGAHTLALALYRAIH